MIVDLVRTTSGASACRAGRGRPPVRRRGAPRAGASGLDVSGTLRPGTTWRDLLAASFPPGSVSGAPKPTALQAIADLEPVPRGPYCGAVGWVDADRDDAELAVGIRTFWAGRRRRRGRVLRFGTGAGITWGSDADREWRGDRAQGGACCGRARHGWHRAVRGCDA